MGCGCKTKDAGYRQGGLFDRDTQGVIFDPAPEMVPQPGIDYDHFGYLPGVAQTRQFDIGSGPVMARSAFTKQMAAVAEWFSTRVHLGRVGDA